MVPYAVLSQYYDRLMYDVDYDTWAAYVEELLIFHGMPEATPWRLLDAGCGTGSVLLRLASRGHRVTGLDVSKAMLDIAKDKARILGIEANWVCQDISELTLTEEFDCIIATCDTLNHLPSLTVFSSAIHQMYLGLKPGGLLLFDLNTEFKLQTLYGDETFAEVEEDMAYVWENAYDPSSRRCEMHLTFFIRQGDGMFQRVTDHIVQRAHTMEEVAHTLSHAGFETVGIYEAFTNGEPRDDTERVCIVARRSY